MTLNTTAEMQRTFKLPKLPGNTWGEDLLRQNFRKTQVLTSMRAGDDRRINTGMPVDFDSSSIAARTSLGFTAGSTLRSTHSDVIPSASCSPGRTDVSDSGALQQVDRSRHVRQHTGIEDRTLALADPNAATSGPTTNSTEGHVLRFFAYYIESVTESVIEKERVRKCVICYYLDDGTLSVSEPRVDNSGISPQGITVKRHPVLLPDRNGFITYQHLAVGGDVEIYCRTYHIADCDPFTRTHMAILGVTMLPGESYPFDAYTELRKPHSRQQRDGMAPLAGLVSTTGRKVKLTRAEVHATQQFLQHDRQVLRFHAIWDDSKSLYGEVHQLMLYYFLSDGSLEVCEKSSPNSGRDAFPSFLRRQRIAKPQARASPSVGRSGDNPLVPKEKRPDDAAHYTDADLTIGATVILFGRQVRICDYDAYTREHMKQTFGITAYRPIESLGSCGKTSKPVFHDVPPYNGFGDEEDSLRSCRTLDHRASKRDTTKWDKYGESVVKFSLKLDSTSPTDTIREFVLSCFLADSTIAIFEPAKRNSGIVGGKFLQRQKVKNADTGTSFMAADFFVGRKVIIHGFTFIVLATDERSLALMEAHSSDFAKSNVNTVVHKLQAMLLSSQSGLMDALRARDPELNHVLVFSELSTLFQSLGLPVCEQEIMTILRYFDRNGDCDLTSGDLIQRLLGGSGDERDVPASDPRSWEEVFSCMVTLQNESVQIRERVDRQRGKVLTITAAYAARRFLEVYQTHRQLFYNEFKFMTDYAPDSKIGAKEFRQCCTEKLNVGLSDVQYDALCDKLFPSGARRVSLEEFMRLLNNTSIYPHNLQQIRDRR